MDNSVQASSPASSKQTISVDVNEEKNPVLNEANDELKTPGTSKCSHSFRLSSWQIRFLLLYVKSHFWSILNFITKPVAVCSIFATIAIPIGIIIVYFTSPKQLGMFFFFFDILISIFEIYL